MFKNKYKTTHNPEISTPPGIPYIIGNEIAERFSYFGMRSILFVFMTQYLLNINNTPEFTNLQAMVWYHTFDSACYIFPVLGSFIADIFWGKYKTIIVLSIIYCLGHLTLALISSKIGLAYGLILIAIGTGGIKSCVAAHVGDQFNRNNRGFITTTYSWFYSVISIGAFVSMLLVPYLLEKYGPHVAFGTPGILMLIATIIFYQGRKVFTAIPPVGLKRYMKEVLDPINKKAILNIMILFSFMSVFFSLMDQSGSSWVIQAGKMNRNIDLGFIKFTFKQSQVQAVNPVFVLILTPIFSYIIYPFFAKFTKITYLKKIASGFFFGTISFMIITVAQVRLEQGIEVGMIWQIFAFIFLAMAEITVFITGIEIAYVHAPNSMKSLFLALYSTSIALGDFFTAIINYIIQDPNGNPIISGSTYFWFFTGLMVIVGILFIIYMPHYKGKVHLQKMKTSVPSRSVEHHSKISKINDVILQVAKKKTAFIVFLSDIVHRGQQRNFNIKEPGNDNDYNFLIVTKLKKYAKSNLASELEGQIRNKLISEGIESFNDKITISIESIDQFNLRSEKQRLFKEGILLYDVNQIKLSEPKQITKERRKEIAQKGYKHWYKKGLDFLKIYEAMKHKIDDNGLLVLHLHQATESFYNCSLLVLTGNKPHSHELARLNYLLCAESNKFANIFPVSSKWEGECFKLLENGYINSRYDFDFLITNQQLEYLADKIIELRNITKEIYEEEMKMLETQN